MKKINILIFIMLIFAFILTGCSGSKASGVTEGVKVNKEDLKIGFVHYSDPSDQGYTYTHDSSTWKMAAALGIDKSEFSQKSIKYFYIKQTIIKLYIFYVKFLHCSD